MRHASPQLPLTAPWIHHAHTADLAAMSALLDELRFANWRLQDSPRQQIRSVRSFGSRTMDMTLLIVSRSDV